MRAKCDRCQKDMPVKDLLHLEYAHTFRTIKGMNHEVADVCPDCYEFLFNHSDTLGQIPVEWWMLSNYNTWRN